MPARFMVAVYGAPSGAPDVLGRSTNPYTAATCSFSRDAVAPFIPGTAMNQSIPLILPADIKTKDALLVASDYLNGAAAIAYETADNSTPEYRPLARSGLQQLNIARAVIDALVVRETVEK